MSSQLTLLFDNEPKPVVAVKVRTNSDRTLTAKLYERLTSANQDLATIELGQWTRNNVKADVSHREIQREIPHVWREIVVEMLAAQERAEQGLPLREIDTFDWHAPLPRPEPFQQYEQYVTPIERSDCWSVTAGRRARDERAKKKREEKKKKNDRYKANVAARTEAVKV
jgi:hypothetical protein